MPTRRLFCFAPLPAAGGIALLSSEESHHARDVVRLEIGQAVELFDSTGTVARARIVDLSPVVRCQVDSTVDRSNVVRIRVASAVPKGDRADWMIEKLSEVGVDRFTPLRTARSVVHPTGAGKADRWRRLAIESAKQSRRAGLMTIDDLADVATLDLGSRAIVLSTRDGARPMHDRIAALLKPHGPDASERGASVLLLVGPEGGWTEDELASLVGRGVAEASLTDTVLRIETAAVVAAGLAASQLASAEAPR